MNAKFQDRHAENNVQQLIESDGLVEKTLEMVIRRQCTGAHMTVQQYNNDIINWKEDTVADADKKELTISPPTIITTPLRPIVSTRHSCQRVRFHFIPRISGGGVEFMGQDYIPTETYEHQLTLCPTCPEILRKLTNSQFLSPIYYFNANLGVSVCLLHVLWLPTILTTYVLITTWDVETRKRMAHLAHSQPRVSPPGRIIIVIAARTKEGFGRSFVAFYHHVLILIILIIAPKIYFMYAFALAFQNKKLIIFFCLFAAPAPLLSFDNK